MKFDGWMDWVHFFVCTSSAVQSTDRALVMQSVCWDCSSAEATISSFLQYFGLSSARAVGSDDCDSFVRALAVGVQSLQKRSGKASASLVRQSVRRYVLCSHVPVTILRTNEYSDSGYD